MGRTKKQQKKERERRHKAALRKIGAKRPETFTLRDMERRLRRSYAARRVVEVMTPKPEKPGIVSRILGLFGRKKGPK